MSHLLAVTLAFLGDLTDSIWFYVIMILLLVGLVVVLFIVRGKREED